MPVSDSGRVLVELDPIQKAELYHALRADGLTLKDWFLHYRGLYLMVREQPSLFGQPPLPVPKREPQEEGEE
jgi:hypothetical protein